MAAPWKFLPCSGCCDQIEGCQCEGAWEILIVDFGPGWYQNPSTPFNPFCAAYGEYTVNNYAHHGSTPCYSWSQTWANLQSIYITLDAVDGGWQYTLWRVVTSLRTCLCSPDDSSSVWYKSAISSSSNCLDLAAGGQIPLTKVAGTEEHVNNVTPGCCGSPCLGSMPTTIYLSEGS